MACIWTDFKWNRHPCLMSNNIPCVFVQANLAKPNPFQNTSTLRAAFEIWNGERGATGSKRHGKVKTRHQTHVNILIAHVIVYYSVYNIAVRIWIGPNDHIAGQRGAVVSVVPEVYCTSSWPDSTLSLQQASTLCQISSCTSLTVRKSLEILIQPLTKPERALLQPKQLNIGS